MLSTPSTLPTDLVALPVLPWVPEDFEIHAIINKRGRQGMDLTGMYMNAIYAMYDMCYIEQHANIPRRVWSLPEFDVTVDILATEARLAIWGLQGTADADAGAGVWPLISQLMLGGEIKGHISIKPRSESQGSSSTLSEATNTSSVSVHPVNAVSNFDTVFDLGGEMDVHQSYNGADLKPQYVFSLCLRVMSYGSQFGRDNPASMIDFDEGFVLRSEVDATGRPKLRYRHLSKLMRVVAKTMVRNSRFGEMDVELWKYGERIAWGRLEAGAELSMIGVSVNNTVIHTS